MKNVPFIYTISAWVKSRQCVLPSIEGSLELQIKGQKQVPAAKTSYLEELDKISTTEENVSFTSLGYFCIFLHLCPELFRNYNVKAIWFCCKCIVSIHVLNISSSLTAHLANQIW